MDEEQASRPVVPSQDRLTVHPELDDLWNSLLCHESGQPVDAVGVFGSLQKAWYRALRDVLGLTVEEFMPLR
jgi:hypothetical protein